ncbi:MAG TPA: hypothetical protein VMH39_06235 [Gemmatimonadaceae bacterium]|nr:hypothetical protein [Gemmatimonadaceae bacterium]
MHPREAKPEWLTVSRDLRAAIERTLGAPVVRAEPVWGGFGPNATFRLALADEQDVFCKAHHPDNSAFIRSAVARECEIFGSCPEIHPFAPRFLGVARHDDEWALLLQFAGDRVAVPPWDDARIDETLRLVLAVHALGSNGSPWPLWGLLTSWRELFSNAVMRVSFAALFSDPPAVARWLDDHGPRLLALETAAPGVAWQAGALHLDLRSDNILYTRSRGPLLVDWPHFSRGPRALDIGFFAPSVQAEGGPRASEFVRRYQAAWGSTFRGAELEAAAVVVAGFFAARAPLPELADLPRLRWIQKVQLFPALEWLCEVLSIDWPATAPPRDATPA